MYKKILLRCAGLLAVSLFSISIVHAGSKYWAVGGGNSSFDIKPLFGTKEVDDTTAVRFLFGHRYNNTGFELDISLADYDWVNVPATHSVSNLVFAGVGYLPVSDSIEFFLKGGLNMWSTTVDYYGTTYDGDDSFGLSIGGGVSFVITKKFNLRAEYQMLNGIGDGVDEGDISQFLINAVFYY